MPFAGISWLAVILATVTAFMFSGIWYAVFAASWMRAAGFSERPRPSPAPFVIAALAQLALAYFLAGLVAHLGPVTVTRALTVAFFTWAAFSFSTMLVNHRFQNDPWALTLIDGGHWLGVFLLQAIVIGAMGI